MAYGHAEQNLALLRQLEAETRQLLRSLDQPDPEQSAWPQEVTSGDDDRGRTAAGRAGCVPAGPGDDGDVRLLCDAGADDAEAVGFVPYLPLGHGFPTGTVRSASRLREGDVRTTMPRFADGNLRQSLCIVEAVAKDAGATPAQVALVWLLAQGDDLAPLSGARHVARLEENLAADRLELIAARLARLTTIAPAVGTRYPEQFMPEVDR